MKRSTSRLLSTLLVLCLVLALLPGTAWGDALSTSKITIQYDSRYDSQNMVEILTASQTTPLSGKGWSYEPASNTLILDGFDGYSISVYEGKEKFDNFTLELRGTNTLSRELFFHCGSGDGGCTATITGSGSLDVGSFYSLSMDIVMKGSTITATGTKQRPSGSCAMYLLTCSFHMTGGSLNALGGDYGICVEPTRRTKIILEGGTVTAYGDYAAIWSQEDSDDRAHGTDMFDFGRRTPVGGKAESDRQVLSVQEIDEDVSTDYYSYYNTQHIIALTSGKLTPGTGAGWKQIGAAKYAYISDAGQATQPTTPDTPTTPDPATAYASTQTVELDDKKVEFQMYALKDANGNDTNYIKVRDLAMALKGTKAEFSVDWADGAVKLAAGETYTPNGSENATPFSGNRGYTVPTDPTNVNGEASDLQAILLTDDGGGGFTYYKLRDLGSALGFNVGWSAERGVYIESDKPYSE